MWITRERVERMLNERNSWVVVIVEHVRSKEHNSDCLLNVSSKRAISSFHTHTIRVEPSFVAGNSFKNSFSLHKYKLSLIMSLASSLFTSTGANFHKHTHTHTPLSAYNDAPACTNKFVCVCMFCEFYSSFTLVWIEAPGKKDSRREEEKNHWILSVSST